MNTWWSARAIPVVLLASLTVGCKGGDSDDEDTDSPPVDTVFVDSVPDEFRPTSLSYSAEFAIGDDGLIRGFSQQGTALPPYFLITLSDGRDDCEVLYEILPQAYGHVGQIQDSAPVDTSMETGDSGTDTDMVAPPSNVNAGLLNWLDENNLLFGFKLEKGAYNEFLSDACAELPDDFYESDLAEELLLLTSEPTERALYVGFDLSIDDSLLDSFEGSDITEDQLLGGRMQFPFEYESSQGGMRNYFDISGIYAEVDEDFELQATPDGLLVLKDSADAWDGRQPGLGFYRLFSPFGWNLAP